MPSAVGEASSLDAPCRAQAANYRPRDEVIEGFTETRAGGVLNGGDPRMVSPVVLDEEVP
jgi:hypothetical protein